MMAPALRTGIDKLRFVTQDIGGGFGNKICTHPQLVALCLLSRKLKRACNWTEWRTDQHMANSHGNERVFLDVEVPVTDDGLMLGFKARMIDDCGAYTRYEPLGCIIWSQVTPGVYRWRNVRVDFQQVCSNKSPCGPNRGYSRMQHLWFTERIMDIVAQELNLDPVEVRKKNYIRTDEMPYETPNGCVYDSGDYAQCLDKALELIDYRSIEERRRDAESRGKLLGVGIGSTLDSGTNNFGQSQLVNPDLQFSGNNEVATVKLDIFGEIVVTIGTTPQGQGHETTAAQVVADILGVTPDDGERARRPRLVLELARRLLGHVRVAVRGHRPRRGEGRGRHARARDQAARRRRARRRAPEDIELADGFARIKGNPEAALPFMACGAIVNANNAVLPLELRDLTLNCRYVYVPPHQVPDKERKFGNLTLTYATQIHACVVEIDEETGAYDIVDYGAVDDCGIRINPQIVEGQVHGATAHAIGGATHEHFPYDEQGNLLTPNFYDYHVPHAMDMPPLKTDYVESPVAVHAARREGHGGGRRRRAVGRLLGDPERAALGRRRDRLRQLQPVLARLGADERPGERARERVRGGAMKVEGSDVVQRSARRRLGRAERPGADGADDAEREVVRRPGRPPLECRRRRPARARLAEDVDRVRQDRGAAARVREAEGEGHGRRRAALDGDAVRALRRRRRGTDMKWEADVQIAGPVGAMGQRVSSRS